MTYRKGFSLSRRGPARPGGGRLAASLPLAPRLTAVISIYLAMKYEED